MKKVNFEFEGNRIPTMFSTSVITRMFEGNPDGMRAFLDSYNGAKIRNIKKPYLPTELELQIAQAYKEICIERGTGGAYIETSRKLGLPRYEVQQAVLRVLRYNFITA